LPDIASRSDQGTGSNGTNPTESEARSASMVAGLGLLLQFDELLLKVSRTCAISRSIKAWKLLGKVGQSAHD